jgi:hypothetical protein
MMFKEAQLEVGIMGVQNVLYDLSLLQNKKK